MLKRSFVTFLLISIAVFLSGCGGGSTSSANRPPTYPIITGNWSLLAVSQVYSQTIQIGGYITNTDGGVSGTIHVLNSGCFTLTQDVPISGTITSSGSVSATSAAVSGQVIAISGTVSGSTLSAGTYSISGGCGDGDKGTLTGFITPSYSNTYKGSFHSVSGITTGETFAITQNGPDSDGFYHLSGTATFTNSPCFASGTISSSAVAGSYMEVIITTNNNGTVMFAGNITDSSGTTITGEYEITSGACQGDSGTGSVSH